MGEPKHPEVVGQFTDPLPSPGTKEPEPRNLAPRNLNPRT